MIQERDISDEYHKADTRPFAPITRVQSSLVVFTWYDFGHGRNGGRYSPAYFGPDFIQSSSEYQTKAGTALA
jgi:hypothetical protein